MTFDRTDGATTVEVVLVLPAFMLVVLLVLQLGMTVHSAQIVEAAAQEAVEATRGESTGDAEARAMAVLDAAGVVVRPTVRVARSTDQVAAAVDGQAPEIVPFMALRVTGRASAPIERFVPEPQRP